MGVILLFIVTPPFIIEKGRDVVYPIQFYEFRTWGLLLKWLRVGVFNKAKLSSIYVNPLLILTIANYNKLRWRIIMRCFSE